MTAGYLVIVLGGLVILPWESHRQFPARYLSGFPGAAMADAPEAREFLTPERDPLIARLGLGAAARAHRDLARFLTAHFVAVRAEEHRLFFEAARTQASRIRSLIARGLLPRDARIALDCVGVIPYETGLPTLDRLGLTDAHVARSPAARSLMAHARSATLEYARERGVELWAADPFQLVCGLTSKRLLISLITALDGEAAYYAAPVGGDEFVLAALPLGLEDAGRRMPLLAFRPLADRDLAARILEGNVAALRESLRAHPDDPTAAWDLCNLLLVAGAPDSRPVLLELARRLPGDLRVLEALARCEDALGDEAAVATTLRSALDVARADDDVASERRIAELLTQLSGPGRE